MFRHSPPPPLPPPPPSSSSSSSSSFSADPLVPGSGRANCMCCNTLLEYPRNASGFICAVCKTKHDFYPPRPSGQTSPSDSPRLSLPYLRELCDTARQAGNNSSNYAALKAYLRTVGSSMDRLNEAFLSDADLATRSSTIMNQNFSDVREMYRLLMGLPDDVLGTWTDAVTQTLLHPGRFLTKPYELRFLLIILENPLFHCANPRYGPFCNLIGLMSNLNNELQRHVVVCLSQIPKLLFEQFVRSINGVISTRFGRTAARLREDLPPDFPKPTLTYHMNDWVVSACSKFLAVFWVASTSHAITNLTTFYNADIDKLDISLEYDRWLHVQGFTFCQYPFLLPLTTKSWILELDAYRQMEQEARNAVISLLLMGAVTLPWCTFNVRRDHLVHDSLREISSKRRDLRKKLRIEFTNEEGIDAGGITKEWFMLLVRELFNPDYGMFLQEEGNYLWFNPASLENDSEFYLVGVIVGLALFNSVIVEIPLAPCIYQKLRKGPVTIMDLMDVKPSVARSLQKLLTYEGDFSDLCLSFVASYEQYGSTVSIPLKKNGEEIEVTKENVSEYVSLMVDFHLVTSIALQYEAFERGFFEVCSPNPLTLFHAKELEMLVLGTPVIDIAKLEANAIYDKGITKHDTISKQFWNILRSLTEEQLKKFLLFVTGSDRMPAVSVAPLKMKISLGEHRDTEQLPIAHTCFSQIVVHKYGSEAKFRRKLVMAIEETSGFGVI